MSVSLTQALGGADFRILGDQQVFLDVTLSLNGDSLGFPHLCEFDRETSIKLYLSVIILSLEKFCSTVCVLPVKKYRH